LPTLILVGSARAGTEVSFEMPWLQGGRIVRGVIQGDSRPRDFIPRLVDLFMAGRMPLDRLITRGRLAAENRALISRLRLALRFCRHQPRGCRGHLGCGDKAGAADAAMTAAPAFLKSSAQDRAAGYRSGARPIRAARGRRFASQSLVETRCGLRNREARRYFCWGRGELARRIWPWRSGVRRSWPVTRCASDYTEHASTSMTREGANRAMSDQPSSGSSSSAIRRSSSNLSSLASALWWRYGGRG
jgi:hypothetical protein